MINRNLRIFLFGLFITLTVVNSVGYYLYYHLENKKYKKEFHRKLRQVKDINNLPKEVVQIKINKDDIHKIEFEEEFEFFYNDKKYDILYKIENDLDINFYVLQDDDETKLFRAYKAREKQKNNIDDDNILKQISSYYMQQYDIEFKVTYVLSKYTLRHPFTFYESPFSIQTPPPKLA